MHDLKAVSTLFDLRGDFVHGYSYGSGHINDTYCIWVDQAGQRIRYILQRVNHNVFKQPIPLMENVKRVTDHALKRLKEEQCPEAYRRTLTLVPSVDGKPYALDSDGNCWRVYPFIERARTYDQIETTKQCQEAARAFGEFQKLTADLPGEPLFETIPNFPQYYFPPGGSERSHPVRPPGAREGSAEGNRLVSFPRGGLPHGGGLPEIRGIAPALYAQ